MSDKEVIKRYSNGEITVVWKPALCIHCGFCAMGLPDVFDPDRRPWIKLEGYDTKTIVTQVDMCPSDALSIEPATPQSK